MKKVFIVVVAIVATTTAAGATLSPQKVERGATAALKWAALSATRPTQPAADHPRPTQTPPVD